MADWRMIPVTEIRGPDMAETEEVQIAIPDFEVEALARCLLPKIQVYFESPEGQEAFAEWKKQQNSDDT